MLDINFNYISFYTINKNKNRVNRYEFNFKNKKYYLNIVSNCYDNDRLDLMDFNYKIIDSEGNEFINNNLFLKINIIKKQINLSNYYIDWMINIDDYKGSLKQLNKFFILFILYSKEYFKTLKKIKELI